MRSNSSKSKKAGIANSLEKARQTSVNGSPDENKLNNYQSFFNHEFNKVFDALFQFRSPVLASEDRNSSPDIEAVKECLKYEKNKDKKDNTVYKYLCHETRSLENIADVLNKPLDENHLKNYFHQISEVFARFEEIPKSYKAIRGIDVAFHVQHAMNLCKIFYKSMAIGKDCIDNEKLFYQLNESVNFLLDHLPRIPLTQLFHLFQLEITESSNVDSLHRQIVTNKLSFINFQSESLDIDKKSTAQFIENIFLRYYNQRCTVEFESGHYQTTLFLTERAIALIKKFEKILSQDCTVIICDRFELLKNKSSCEVTRKDIDISYKNEKTPEKSKILIDKKPQNKTEQDDLHKKQLQAAKALESELLQEERRQVEKGAKKDKTALPRKAEQREQKLAEPRKAEELVKQKREEVEQDDLHKKQLQADKAAKELESELLQEERRQVKKGAKKDKTALAKKQKEEDRKAEQREQKLAESRKAEELVKQKREEAEKEAARLKKLQEENAKAIRLAKQQKESIQKATAPAPVKQKDSDERNYSTVIKHTAKNHDIFVDNKHVVKKQNQNTENNLQLAELQKITPKQEEPKPVAAVVKPKQEEPKPVAAVVKPKQEEPKPAATEHNSKQKKSKQETFAHSTKQQELKEPVIILKRNEQASPVLRNESNKNSSEATSAVATIEQTTSSTIMVSQQANTLSSSSKRESENQSMNVNSNTTSTSGVHKQDDKHQVVNTISSTRVQSTELISSSLNSSEQIKANSRQRNNIIDATHAIPMAKSKDSAIILESLPIDPIVTSQDAIHSFNVNDLKDVGEFQAFSDFLQKFIDYNCNFLPKLQNDIQFISRFDKNPIKFIADRSVALLATLQDRYPDFGVMTEDQLTLLTQDVVLSCVEYAVVYKTLSNPGGEWVNSLIQKLISGLVHLPTYRQAEAKYAALAAQPLHPVPVVGYDFVLHNPGLNINNAVNTVPFYVPNVQQVVQQDIPAYYQAQVKASSSVELENLKLTEELIKRNEKIIRLQEQLIARNNQQATQSSSFSQTAIQNNNVRVSQAGLYGRHGENASHSAPKNRRQNQQQLNGAKMNGHNGQLRSKK